VARVPAARARDLAALDAEARTFLLRQSLPAWVGLYRRIKADGRSEKVDVVWRTGERLRSAEPVIHGTLPTLAGFIRDPDQLDASARHVLRLWVAWERRRAAIRSSEEARNAYELWQYLLAHPPSLDRGARNIAAFSAARDAARRRHWESWQLEGDVHWRRQPELSKSRVAALVKKRLRLDEHADTVARHLRRP
jgi:hypothetical protein